MLTLKEGQYILAVWFVAYDETVTGADRADWMALCLKETPAEPWRLCHRVCWHGHAGTPDQRRWEEVDIAGTVPEAEVLDVIEQAAMRVAQDAAAPLQSVYVQGDVHRAVALLQAQPWLEVLSQADVTRARGRPPKEAL